MSTPEYTPRQISEIKDWLGTGSINFFGLPFAGKDTQAERMQPLFGGAVLGGGAILRNSIIPENIQNIMNNGDLIPTEEYVKIVLPYLSSPEFEGQPLFLSSVGRWHGEEESVIEALKKSGHELKAVVHLSLDESVLAERRSLQENIAGRGNRMDDNDLVIEKRIAEFNEKTLPVIDFYRQRSLLVEVDASQNVDDVTQQILSHLAKKALDS